MAWASGEGVRCADVRRFGMADPGDVSALRRAIDAGEVDPATIVAVIGKTHGNGLVNDYTRGYLRQSLALLIAERTGRTPEDVVARVPFIFSGGVEGVLSPHYAVFTVAQATAGGPAPSLAVGVAGTPDLEPQDVGRARQIASTADAVRRAMHGAGLAPEDVHLVQVKGPAFGAAEILAAAQAGREPASLHPGTLMAFGRAASALGVASALGEVDAEADLERAVLSDRTVYSRRASVSAGSEIRNVEVVVLGLGAAWRGPLTIGHRGLADALDLAPVMELAAELGLEPAPQVPAAQAARIRAVLVKCEPQRDGMIRGRPHTMLNDGDIDAQRHVRGAVGAIVASVLNDTALFVSGGAEHQGPDGGGLLAVIAERQASPLHGHGFGSAGA